MFPYGNGIAEPLNDQVDLNVNVGHIDIRSMQIVSFSDKFTLYKGSERKTYSERSEAFSNLYPDVLHM